MSTRQRNSSEYSRQDSSSVHSSSLKSEVQVADDEKSKARLQIYKYVFSDWMAIVAIFPSFAFGAIPIFTFLLFGDIITPLSVYLIESLENNDPKDPMKDILHAVLKMIGVAVASGVCRFFDSFFWVRIGSKLSNRLKRDLFTNMMRSEVTFFDIHPIGSILTVLSEDAQDVENAFGQIKGTQFQNVGQFLMGVIMAFTKSWKLALISLCTVPLMFIVTACCIPGIIKQAMIKFKFVAQSMTIAEETLSAIRTVKGCNREDMDCDRFLDATKKSAKAEEKMGGYVLILVVCIQLIIWGFTILILYYGSTLVDKNELAVGDLFSVFGFTMFGCMGIVQLMSSMQGEQKAISSGARMLKLSQHVPTIPFEGGKKLENFKGHIEFKNVSFKYPTRDVYVLNNVSFEIKPGNMGALVGHSGSGKSTSVQLLERYYDAEEGLVLLDGEDIRTLDPRWLHHVIGLVGQEPSLFQMSIKENIKYGAPDATDEEVYAAADISSARHFIEKLDHGFDQQVGDRGAALSGGQRQRIAIARAVIRNPVILITDEATSALDAASEKKVQKALDKVMEGRTAVVVAHRLSTIRNANIIYVFDAGEIKEVGNHDSLVKLGGYYYNLVKRQMSQKEDIKNKSTIPPKNSKGNNNDDSDDDDDDNDDDDSKQVSDVDTTSSGE
ncbi:hypothetical protein M9Y10_012105 [Tritrichomonas musculus]|uniref:ABC transporter family protein n=1 Tax=Tritrichomonas musculus TaxID=1915356 RepID=A0ABR2IBP8_9EUKA